ncbi:MAG: thioredoxin domain-containing protein, partial [Chloroflexi bacterium]|nr:thioredoxin domain-containing protein [Chloroflexota bacterium]
MPNRLKNETSPYLLQHANNPVDWYPWGEEALQRAVNEDKPIMLSIGYSACHWCHVMERESFEDEAIAALMNQNFISIKVDREERPDLDAVYMEAVQALTGRGGWPMTVFLTPQGKPFYGGTYFPPEDRPGMPGFTRILESVSEAYRTNRGEIERVTNQLTEKMGRTGQLAKGAGLLTDEILHQAYSQLASNFDYQNGGFGAAPKFPQPMTPEFLLRHYHRTGDGHTLEMVNLTLEKMARGGMYDQIGGGFHRYST